MCFTKYYVVRILVLRSWTHCENISVCKYMCFDKCLVLDIYICVCVHVCACVYMYMCVSVCVYVYIYVHMILTDKQLQAGG